jgi:AcrR family transcriptional regulator
VTSRAEILTAARQVIDRDGWEKLTVRRLAAEVGVGTTTLYHHVRDREDLLVQLLDEHLVRSLPAELPSGPRERVVAAATAMHDALAAWPWAAEILTVDGFIARLGESPLTMVEAILAGAVDCGCTDEQAVHLFRSVWYYTVGEILVRAHSAHVRDDEGKPRSSDAVLRSADVPGLPRLAAVADRWSVLAAQDTYPRALRAFVDGLLAQATSSAP